MNSYAESVQAYLFGGIDFTLGQGSQDNGNTSYNKKENNHFGLGMNLKYSHMRWSNRFELINSSFQYLNRTESEKINYSLKGYKLSTGLDYFFDENNPSFYFTFRFGGNKINFKSKESGHSKDQKYISLSPGVGIQYSFKNKIFLFSEILLQKSFITSTKLDDRKINGYSIKEEFITQFNFGVAYEF